MTTMRSMAHTQKIFISTIRLIEDLQIFDVFQFYQYTNVLYYCFIPLLIYHLPFVLYRLSYTIVDTPLFCCHLSYAYTAIFSFVLLRKFLIYPFKELVFTHNFHLGFLCVIVILNFTFPLFSYSGHVYI